MPRQKNALAMTVGTTALPITAATKDEYCALVTIPWDRPNSAEMLPNVRPVDIRSVVYMPSIRGIRNVRVTGYTPAILVSILASSSIAKAAGAATKAGRET